MLQLQTFAPKRAMRQQGFSLVELMVTMVISLMVGLAAVAGAQFYMKIQRQTVGIESAAANATLALADVKTEVAEAGLGFYDKGSFACPQFNLSKNTTTVFNAVPVMPVSIAVTNNLPTLNVYYSTALEAAAATTLAAAASNQDASVQISTYLNVQPGQTVMMAPMAGVPGPCTLRTVTSVVPSAGSGQVLQMDGTGALNQVTFTPVSYSAGSPVMLLGSFQNTTFSVNANGNLVMARPLDGTSAILAKNVVAAVMQYGITDTGSASFKTWRYPMVYSSLSTGSEDWSTVNSSQMSQIRAIRISLLVRSEQKDKPAADGTCSTTATMPSLLGVVLGQAAADDGLPATPTPTTALTGDWQCYRYREVTAIAPLRNFVWGVNT